MPQKKRVNATNGGAATLSKTAEAISMAPNQSLHTSRITPSKTHGSQIQAISLIQGMSKWAGASPTRSPPGLLLFLEISV